MSLIKLLGPEMHEKMVDLIAQVLVEALIPVAWRRNKVSPLYKGSGDRRDPANYRPIAVTPVLYRVCVQVVRERLQSWAERKGVLGELQTGFRSGRGIEDNLFVLTQCVEIAQQTRRPLYVAFLDISKAYDCIDQGILWSILRELGLGDANCELLQALYADMTAEVEWQGCTTAPVRGGFGRVVPCHHCCSWCTWQV